MFSIMNIFKYIIARDIVVRHKIRNTRLAREMAIYLLTNIGKEFSYKSLKETFGVGSVNTIISLISYFEDSYLLFTVPKFSHFLKSQIKNPKKIYSVDNGMAAVNSASFSEDRGRMLEKAVFLHLRRQLTISGKRIVIKPAWKWFTENSR